MRKRGDRSVHLFTRAGRRVREMRKRGDRSVHLFTRVGGVRGICEKGVIEVFTCSLGRAFPLGSEPVNTSLRGDILSPFRRPPFLLFLGKTWGDPAGQEQTAGELVCGTDLVDTEGPCKPARGSVSTEDRGCGFHRSAVEILGIDPATKNQKATKFTVRRFLYVEWGFAVLPELLVFPRALPP